ncbi:E3 ubiquitin/ISG15 ligase TRIM25-like [Gastrophryne carolinensis]
MAGADPSDVCSYCLEYRPDPTALRCGHIFCQDCFVDLRGRGDTCPVCSHKEPDSLKPYFEVKGGSDDSNSSETQQETEKTDICTSSGNASLPANESSLLCEDSKSDRHLNVLGSSPVHSPADPNIVHNKKHNNTQNLAYLNPEQLKEAEIFCTYCLDVPLPAIQSCLHCQASLCKNHLKVHTKSPEHVLTEPMNSFENWICPIHKKILVWFCSQDNVLMCHLCLEDHRNHHVDTLHVAISKTKEKLQHTSQVFSLEMSEIEGMLQDLQKHQLVNAADASERIQAVIEDISRNLDELEKRVTMETSRQRKEVLLSAANRKRFLEKKKNELSKKISDIEGLQQTTDPKVLFQWLNSDNRNLWKVKRSCSEYRKGKNKTDYALKTFDEASILEVLHTGLLEIVMGFKKGIFVEEASNVLLDINTAANNVELSTDLKELSCPGNFQHRIEKEERFQYSQVLSLKDFSSGRNYWDLELGESGNCRVGVAYSSIERKEGHTWIGDNAKSWCLSKNGDTFSVDHNAEKHLLPNCISRKFRIYLDYEAGQLSFYALGDQIRHLHTLTVTFTEPLHAAFCVFLKGSVKILS